MASCSICDAVVPEGVQRCDWCEDELTVFWGESMRCPNCSCVMTPLSGGYHCHNCGKLVTSSEVKKPAPKRPHRRRDGD